MLFKLIQTGVLLLLFTLNAFAFETWQAAFQEGRRAYDTEAYTVAVPALEKAFVLACGTHASELDMANISNSLGAAYEALGRLVEARNLMDASLSARERLLPRDSIDLAISFNNQAGLFWAFNQLQQAEQSVSNALAIWNEAGKPDQPEYAATLSNLAAIRRGQGRALEAQHMPTQGPHPEFRLPPPGNRERVGSDRAPGSRD
jgi:tetratricopeptide (TPR) repeat protein